MITRRFSIFLLIFIIYYCSTISTASVESSSFQVNSEPSLSRKTRTYFDENDCSVPVYTKRNYDRNHPYNSRQNPSKPSSKLSTPDECARPCKAGPKPLTCYYNWTFEYYHTLGSACQLCQPTANASVSSDCQCILADGTYVSGIIVANKMLPGPAIQVCLGDFVVVDVKNMLPENQLTVHWHGIYQKGWQYYDGVPYLTQCPIPESSTFRYQWRAQNAGTHFWHSHTNLHKPEGISGAIIIRQPSRFEPNHKLYDHDEFGGIMFLSDFLHQSAVNHFPNAPRQNVGQIPNNFLINGKGQWTDPTTGNRTTTPLAVFDVKQGFRYRFRIINAFSLGCPAYLTIENHNLTIISIDGKNVRPKTVTTVTTFSAERVDVVLNANQNVGTYWIQLRGLGPCANNNLQQLAILRYVGSNHMTPNSDRPLYHPGLLRGIIFNEVNQICNNTGTEVICVKDLKNIDHVSKKIRQVNSDVQLFLSFSPHKFEHVDSFQPNTYQKYIVPETNIGYVMAINNISNGNPLSPLISQLDDNLIPEDQFCNSTHLPARCVNITICHCTHVVHVPLNAVVDLIVVDGAPNGISHPFHLHGFGYHVMGQGLLSDVNITEANKKIALKLHKKAYPSFHDRPPKKDTLAVASGGYTIVRFIADNPGWWLYHCHYLPHLFNDMGLILHVGEQKDLPPTPRGFPTCGNHILAGKRSYPNP